MDLKELLREEQVHLVLECAVPIAWIRRGLNQIKKSNFVAYGQNCRITKGNILSRFS